MENIELEICKREVSVVKTNFKVPIIISICWTVLAFMINVFISIGNNENMFEEGDLYWIGFGNMLLGLTVLAIFLLLQLRPSIKMSLVLTDKRIYLSSTKKLFFRRTLCVVENHNLNKIVSYEFVRYSRRKRYISQLLLKTQASQVYFIVDEEFYNEFVAAINNAK